LAGARRPLGSSFWALWAANAASGIGDGLNGVAAPLLAATLTHRPVVIAGVAFAQRLPWLFVGLPAGAYADRVDKGQLMRRMDVIRAAGLVTLAGLVLADQVSMPIIYLFALLMGICQPFFAAANQAAVPAIVSPELLGRANGLLEVGNGTTEQTAGPALGGVAFAAARALPFLVDALSFAASAAFLLGLGRRPVRPAGPPPQSALWEEIRAGLAWYRASRALVVVTATVAVLAFTQAMVSAVMVLVALERFHLDSLGYGLLMAGIAVGNVAGGLAAHRILLLTAIRTTLIGAIFVSGAAYLAASRTTSPFVAGCVLALEAMAVVVGNVATISYRQTITPPELQGRVAAVWRTAIWGVIPLGALAGGVVATVGGLPDTLLAAGAAQVVVGVVAAPLLRRHFSSRPA
jgi:hypothetical protein